MLTKAEAEACVLMGVNLLSRSDSEWFMSVSATELDLDSGAWCVLGQWAGSFPEGVMDLNCDNPAGYGFYSSDEDDIRTLEDVWKAEITELKRAHRVKLLAGGASE